MVESEELKPCLMEFSYSFDPLLQNVVAKIVLAMIESHENKLVNELNIAGLSRALNA